MLLLAEMVLAEAGVGAALLPQYTLIRALIDPQESLNRSLIESQ
jgi:hypothetical protein